MCGRTACTLQPEALQKACCYHQSDGESHQPRWVASQHNTKYYPSHNIGPHTMTPVLLHSTTAKKDGLDLPADQENGKATKTDVCAGDRVICTMRWGLLPSWHKGDVNKFSLNMINCRHESLLEKSSFKTPLGKGRRCVVVADGFFEWEKLKSGAKQPYFIYHKDVGAKLEASSAMQDKGKVGDELFLMKQEPQLECREHDTRESDTEKTSVHMLKMAAVYDVWRPKKGGSELPLYTYSIITVAASSDMAWLHDRMPALLNSEEDVSAWLDSENVPLAEALKMLKPLHCLQWHPVSSVVNNVKNKSTDCTKRISVEKQTSASKSLMSNWLKRSPAKTCQDQPESKIKKEEPAIS